MEDHDVKIFGLAGLIFGVIVIGTLLFVAGFATTEWSVIGTSREGLWQQCSCTTPSASSNSWFQTVQAMEVIALILILCAFGLIFVYMFVDGQRGRCILIVLTSGCLFISGVFMVIGFSLYGAHRSGLGASFGISVTGAGILIISAVLTILQILKHN